MNVVRSTIIYLCLLCTSILNAQYSSNTLINSLSLESNSLYSLPKEFELRATIMCSSLPKVPNQIYSIITNNINSVTVISNKVSSLVNDIVKTNALLDSVVWHMRCLKKDDKIRYDSLEDFFGYNVPGASYTNAPLTKIANKYNKPEHKNYTNYLITPIKKSIRISKSKHWYLPLKSPRYILEYPQTIKLIIEVIKNSSDEFTNQYQELSEDISAIDARGSADLERKYPIIKVFYNKEMKKCMGLFVFGENGNITSSAFSIAGLEWPLNSAVILSDIMGGKEKRVVVSIVVPSLCTMKNVKNSQFVIQYPTNWIVINEMKGVATLGISGKKIAKVKRKNNENDNNNTSTIYRIILYALIIIPLILIIIKHIRSRIT
ncbi:MAG: hypothetical protein K9N48_04085 [Verrucomicrobia bacterium]|nr:hypothetical protein [Verrucomicrobiota bacterium]